MICFFIVFIFVNIYSYKFFLADTYCIDKSDIFLFLLCSIFCTFIINLIIPCIVSCYGFEEKCVLIDTEELKPYRKNVYIEEKMSDSTLYYYYNNGEEDKVELDDNIFISYRKVDKPVVKIYTHEYKNSVLRYLIFNASPDKYVFYIPEGSLKQYTNIIE